LAIGFNMKKISVIIVTYNSTDLIIDCINSIYKYNDIGSENIEVIVVDNSHEVESRKMFSLLKQTYGNKLSLIKNQKNLGYGYGNNIGIEHSTGDIICIMNPDVRLSEPIFQKTLNKFENDGSLGLIGFKQKGGNNLSFYIKPEYHLSLFNSMAVKIFNKLNYFNSKFFFLSGALFFMDKCKFLDIKKFDNRIFLYSEESDISNRLINKGYTINYISKHKYIHLVNKRSLINSTTRHIMLQSAIYYLLKYKKNPNIFIKKKYIELIFKLFISKLLFKRDLSLNFKQSLAVLKQYHKNAKSKVV